MGKKDLTKIIEGKSFISKEFLKDNGGSIFLCEDERRDLIRTIEEHNAGILQRIKAELEQYKNKITPQSTTKKICKTEKIPANETNLIDISFYWKLFQTCSSEEQISLFLPKRKNKNFELIINSLIKNLLIEINNIEKFIIEEKLSAEMKKDFLEEIALLRNKVSLLVQYRDKKINIQNEEVESTNKLIYLQTPSGNYYAINDMKSIDVDYYDSFLELLQSIKDGTFKNIKAFNNNGKIDDFLEVKNFKTRIIFKRLSADTFLIVSIFMKKVDSDLAYSEHLKNRSSILQQSLPFIKQNLNDPAYLLANDQITQELEIILKKDRGLKNGRN